jgi:acetyltransferase-like isoleucine patch superfamily enzyme
MLRVIGKVLKNIELSVYNEYTIENYFKRKGFRIGKHNRIYISDFGSEPYLIEVGDHCTIAAGVRLITHDGGCWVFRQEIPDLNVFGNIRIKDNCFIGMNSIILPNVTIGPHAVVGAGSVVTKDVPAYTVVAGVPAKELCKLDEYKEKCLRKAGELNLQGSHSSWKKQLIKYFWLSNRTKEK